MKSKKIDLRLTLVSIVKHGSHFDERMFLRTFANQTDPCLGVKPVGKRTKISSMPSTMMNPYPFSGLYVFTVPIADIGLTRLRSSL